MPIVGAAAQVRTHHVIIDGMRFTPAVLTVQRGAGQHSYLCTLHSAMKGTLTVREDAPATR